MSEKLTIWRCPGCGHWSGSTYLRPTEENAEWRPRCKMKGPVCSRPLMNPVEVVPASSLAVAVQALEIIANQGKAAVEAYNDPRRGLPTMFSQLRDLARSALARIDKDETT